MYRAHAVDMPTCPPKIEIIQELNTPVPDWHPKKLSNTVLFEHISIVNYPPFQETGLGMPDYTKTFYKNGHHMGSAYYILEPDHQYGMVCEYARSNVEIEMPLPPHLSECVITGWAKRGPKVNDGWSTDSLSCH